LLTWWWRVVISITGIFGNIPNSRGDFAVLKREFPVALMTAVSVLKILRFFGDLRVINSDGWMQCTNANVSAKTPQNLLTHSANLRNKLPVSLRQPCTNQFSSLSSPSSPPPLLSSITISPFPFHAETYFP